MESDSRTGILTPPRLTRVKKRATMKRKPSKLDLCIKKRGLLAGQITLRKGVKNRVKKQGSSNVDLLGLEEWQ